MKRLSASVLLACCLPVAAQDPDLSKAKAELAHVFDRQSGTVIGAEQKARLAAFLEARKGQDLGELGYASALQRYLDRDVDGAVVELDRFFDRYATIDNAEHLTMLGRVYVNAVSQEARKAEPDVNKLATWGERMAKFYDNAALLSRITTMVDTQLKDATPFRLGVAKGVLASTLEAKEKDELLRTLYAPAGAEAAGAKPAVRAAGATAPVQRIQRSAPAGIKEGEDVAAFEILRTLNGQPFDLYALRGKVVVLDFFATWCPPCRASVPSMVELQKSAGSDLQVVGITRYYGRGMDFSAPGVALPHGGVPVKDLDENAEIAINESFIKAFGVNYPLAFTTTEVTSKQFGVTGIPTMFVIGKDGKLVGRVVGGGEVAHTKVLELVETARKG